MSSSQQKVIHQDYIARIRYSNVLPPPPNPPKLLDIPNTGLASGQYTNPGFASRLARDQPLNIEADAELGMPLDLVGMPGIFDGDESSIQAPLQQPPVHPNDRPLLRSVQALGKSKLIDSGVSFLRRTEYISSASSRSRFDATTPKDTPRTPGGRKKRSADNINKESPEYIKSQVEKSFGTAAGYLSSGNLMKHPNKFKSHLKLVGSYPLLPDQHAVPDTGGYVTIKFDRGPLPPTSTYDQRLEHSILRPIMPDEEVLQQRAEAREAHARDPERNPPVDDPLEYEYFLPDTLSDAMKFKRKFDPNDSDNEDEDMYPHKNEEGQGYFRFNKLRPYESSSAIDQVDERFDRDVCLAIHEADGSRPKGAYYYPIVQKLQIRARRSKNINNRRNRFQGTQEDAVEDTADCLDIRIYDPTAEMKKERDNFAVDPYNRNGDAASPDGAEENDASHDED